MAAGQAPSWSRTSTPGRHHESRPRHVEGGNMGRTSPGRCHPPGHVEDEAFSAAEVPDASPTSIPGATDVTTRSMTPDEDRGTEIRFLHSDLFPHVLQETACSLLVSTYQAGQLVAVGVHDEQLIFSFRRFDRAMGVALGTDQIAVAGKEQIWSLQDHTNSPPRSSPPDATTGAGSRAPRPSPARSNATRSPGEPATAASRTCGSSTPSCPAWPASIPATTSSRAGGHRSSPGSPRRTAATSTAWPCATKPRPSSR